MCNFEKLKNKKLRVLQIFLFIFFVFGVFGKVNFVSAADIPPSIINYQGKLLNSGVAVDATTTMGFIIFDSLTNGTALYTANGALPATSTIQVAVSNGIFSVNLGDAGTNSLGSNIFANNSNLYLEVWVDGVAMSPRKQLVATPFSLNSAYLMGYGVATASTSEYIPRSDAAGNFSFSGTPMSSDVWGGTIFVNPGLADPDDTILGVGLGGVEKFRVDAEGDAWFTGAITATGTATSSFTNVLATDGIILGGTKRTTWPTSGGSGDISSSTDNTFTGVNTFTSTSIFLGKIGEPSLFASYTSSTIMDGPTGVAVQGDYAFVTGFLADTVTAVDVSSSTHPIFLSTLTVGSRPSAIVVQGNYAYMTSYFGDSVQVIDVSNPKSMSIVATVGGSNLTGPRGIVVSGNYAYVAAADADKFTIIDISDPKSPTVMGVLANGTDGALLNEPWSIALSGKYAYVVSETSDSFTVIDISDPRNPRHVSSLADGVGVAPYLDGAHSVAVSGKYAYVGSIDGVNQGVQILDISDPTDVTSLGALNGEGQSTSLWSAGDYLYAFINTFLEVVDIRDPNNPVVLSTVSAGTGNSLMGQNATALSGNKIYLTEYNFDDLRIYDVTGVTITNVETGNATISNLIVRNDVDFGNQVSVRGGLSVGNSGLLLNGDFSMSSATSSLAATNTLHFSHTALFETFVSTTDDHAFIFNTKNTMTSATTTYLFSIRNNGTSKLSLASNGNLSITGIYYGLNAIIGTPGAPGDLAERVDIAVDDEVESGDVVVVDPNATDTYRKSSSAYSDQVSGVISSNPTIVIGNGKTEHTAVMAMVGRVPVKVSTENGSIMRGDLLVTASSTGYAMKYDPTKDTGSHIAGIVGVALESFENGKGKIMGLVRTGWLNGEYRQTFSELRAELSKLALVQSNMQSGNEVTVAEKSDGTIASINQDLNLNGFSLLSVKSIRGMNEKWQIDEEGRFTTTVDTVDGAKTLYALQSGESQYVFSGTGTLVNGKVRVDFDKSLLDIVDTSKTMSINLTLAEKAKGIYVSGRDETGFDVEEMDGGTSNARFDWLVFATRKADLDEGASPTTTSSSESDSDSDSDHAASDVSSDTATSTTSDTSSPVVDDTPVVPVVDAPVPDSSVPADTGESVPVSDGSSSDSSSSESVSTDTPTSN